MDIGLARTFLEVVQTGSFVAAAERLHLTQTGISARIRALEEHLGRRLFVRSKAGARLTAAGERFVRPATILVQVWQQARQQVALPAGRETVISIGGELSLWNPLLTQWLVRMREIAPDIALRAEVDVGERLLDRVQAGSLDLAIVYGPQPRPGLVAELVAEEKLVMVTSAADGRWTAEDYVFVDWGPAFRASHDAAFPTLANPPVSISLGPLALEHVLLCGGTGYFRAQAVAPHIASGRLRLVPDAPEFSYAATAVHSSRADADLLERARSGWRSLAPAPGPGRREA